MNQPKRPDNERPISITTICLFYFILIPIMIAILIFALSLPSVQQELSSQEIFVGLFMVTILLVSSIGLWRMKRWGAYGYIGATALNLFDTTLPIEKPKAWAIVIQVLFTYFILKNISKMT